MLCIWIQISLGFSKEPRFSFPYTSRKFNLLPEVKSSHVLWIAIFPADKQIMHLPSDHVSKIYSYHFPDTRTRSTIRSSDRAFTVDRLLRKERVHFVHTCYIVNSPTWTIISHSAEPLCTKFQIPRHYQDSSIKYRWVTDNHDHVDHFSCV